MIYAFIGKAVVKGLKVLLRQRYGPTYTPKPVLAGAVVLAAVGLGLAVAKRETS